MEEEAERETSAQDMSEGAERDEGGTGLHDDALRFTQEEDQEIAGGDVELLRISGADVGLRTWVAPRRGSTAAPPTNRQDSGGGAIAPEQWERGPRAPGHFRQASWPACW
jgi:hypothetical protein